MESGKSFNDSGYISTTNATASLKRTRLDPSVNLKSGAFGVHG